MKKLKYILFIFCFTFHYSCDSFLDVRPEGEVVNNELFKSAQGFEDAIYGVYSTLAGPSYYGRTMTYYFNDILSQYFFYDWPGDVTLKICNFEYKDAQVRPTIDQIWGGMYKSISYVNNILENLDQHSESSLPLYPVYKAECLALRGFMHFDILRLFSENIVNNKSAQGIPYVDKYNLDVSPFLSAEAVYARIIGDLQEAEKIMLENGEYFKDADRQSNEFLKDRQIHLNLYAIQGMLARVYWMKGELKTAAEYAQKVLDCGYFELAEKSEIEDLVNGVLSPKETVWGLFSSTFYTNVRSNLYLSGNPGCLFLKSDHDDAYQADKEGTDYRYEKWFKNYSAVEANGLRCIKILDTYQLSYSTRPDTRILGINMLRLPELYYIITEYYLSIQNQTEAVKYFDQVLKSRGLTGYADRQGATLSLDQVIRERRKELICEGQYFFTQKRYNQDILEPKGGKTYKASNDIYVFPIPENETEYRY